MATQMFKERVKAVLKNKDLQLAHKRTDQDVVQPSIIRSNETRTTWARIRQTVSDELEKFDKKASSSLN